MSQLAIDIVILPPKEIAEKAIAISTRLQQKENGVFALGETDYFPHITIAMGVVDEQNIPELIQRLKTITQRTKPFPLTVEKLENMPSAVGGIVAGLAIGKSVELKGLHKNIVDQISPLLSFDATVNMFIEPETVKESTLLFVKNFPKKFDFEKYEPHLTLGRGASDDTFEPTGFQVGTVAICQLGHFCTCRKILFQTKLS